MDSILHQSAETNTRQITDVRHSGTLILPYGGKLVNLLVPPDEQPEAAAYAKTLPSIQLTARTVCDLELLAVGAFSPLDGFMNRADYRRVLDEMRLTDNHLFPIPVTLGVENAAALRIGQAVALRDARNDVLAVLEIEDVYEWQPEDLAQKVFGTLDARHPLVAEINYWGRFNLAGRLRVLRLPHHPDFQNLRLTPDETRQTLEKIGNPNVVAFQTRNPLHRAHEEMTRRAMDETGATLLLHPVVGITKTGDIDYFTRVRSYLELVRRYYDKSRILLALLPLAMRFAGPREALWHAVIRRNYGANYLIVGRDHASPGADSAGKPFYPPIAAQEFVRQYSTELGVNIVRYDEFVYLPDEKRYEEVTKIPPRSRTESLSGTRIRQDFLNKNEPLPEWYLRPEIARLLEKNSPPQIGRGVCLWFTGLSGAGKSTTAEALEILLIKHGRQVTVLDGDVVRTHLSKGLGFSREDRDTNVCRIGFVAAEIVRHGGAVICAAVSPYRTTRNAVRNMFGDGDFVEILVSTPLEICEQRDAKGLYQKARRGEIKNFTGIDDIYEPPLKPEITLDTVGCTAAENASRVLSFLIDRGGIRRENDFTDIPDAHENLSSQK